ncbi:Rieske (2Fe-2S) protein [Nocardioides sp. C4-1]|uniref:Rieske (2Fe-2S) protein n=1 Tax=Nocardioides sp. C4-1 TaxID=3151851 RepID=UPI003266B2E3
MTAGFRPSRRIVFQGMGALGVACVLAACGGGDGDSGGGGAAPEAGAGLVAAADVPVGGGVVLPDANMVVTQPTEGVFKGFSSRCTHQGVAVDAVEGGEIRCPAHGSAFSIDDGSVVNPPASSPLEEIAVAVEGDQVVAA